MKTIVAAVVGMCLSAGITASVAGRTQLATPNPENLRFRLVGDEPIAGPDGRTTVRGWKVLVFKDVVGKQCYIAFVNGEQPSATGPTACP